MRSPWLTARLSAEAAGWSLSTAQRYLRAWEALQGSPGVPRVRLHQPEAAPGRPPPRPRYEVLESDLAAWCGCAAEAA